MTALRGAAAVIGVGESDLGKLPDSTGSRLRAQAAARALDDAGLEPGDVDAIFTTAGSGFPAIDLAEKLGLRPKVCESTLVGGASFVSYLSRATAAIANGACSCALVVYGESSWANLQRKGGLYGGQHALVPERPEFEDLFGNFLIASYAMATRRHMHQYGTTPEDLASVAVLARTNAAKNPKALLRDPITVEDVLASRMIAEPLHLLDCCSVHDGGAAFVVVGRERALRSGRRVAYFLGGGEAMTHNLISQMPDLTTTAAVESGRQAFEMAAIKPADVDLAEIYDAFTYLPILFLEDLGFCAKGDAGSMVRSGACDLDGDLPLNTHGGALSYAMPGMHGAFLVVEAVRQLRGDAHERQVTDAEIALIHGNGGVLSFQSTAILASSPS
jgi:acetyl-CoA acetyltransferase